MEMPKYRLPSFKTYLSYCFKSSIDVFKWKAGTYILAASLIIWFASNYPKHHDMEDSYNQKIELATTDEDKTVLKMS